MLETLDLVKRASGRHDESAVDHPHVRICRIEDRGADRGRADIDLREIDASFFRAIDDATLEEICIEDRPALARNAYLTRAIQRGAAKDRGRNTVPLVARDHVTYFAE